MSIDIDYAERELIEENQYQQLSIYRIPKTSQYYVRQGVREYSFLKLEDAKNFARQMLSLLK